VAYVPTAQRNDDQPCVYGLLPPDLGEKPRRPVNSNVPERPLSNACYGSNGHIGVLGAAERKKQLSLCH